MMTIELKINGRIIGNIGVHNTAVEGKSGTVYDVYDLRGIEAGDTLQDADMIGSVTHRRQSGAAALTAKVMNQVVTEENLEPEMSAQEWMDRDIEQNKEFYQAMGEVDIEK